MKRLDPKNAEVTKKGVKVRGDPAKGKQTTVLINPSSSNLKKKLLYIGTTVMASAIYIGICSEGIEYAYFKDMMYLTSFLYAMQMLTIRFTKME